MQTRCFVFSSHLLDCDVHLKPARECLRHINEPTNIGGSLHLSMQIPRSKQMASNIQTDLHHLHKICGSPPGNICWVPDAASVAEVCYLPAMRIPLK